MSINRKLIRSDLSAARQAASTNRKKAPPAETAAEAFYFVKQMSGKTPMVVVTLDGEVLNGVIEWYDEGAIKLHRRGAPNLLLMKHAIKYMHKEGDMGSLDEPSRDESPEE
jgi:sRNA-binding regulator protein Hfq